MFLRSRLTRESVLTSPRTRPTFTTSVPSVQTRAPTTSSWPTPRGPTRRLARFWLWTGPPLPASPSTLTTSPPRPALCHGGLLRTTEDHPSQTTWSRDTMCQEDSGELNQYKYKIMLFTLSLILVKLTQNSTPELSVNSSDLSLFLST